MCVENICKNNVHLLFVNFRLYYVICFCGRASCNKKIFDFNLLTVVLSILSARVGEVHAHTFLIHIHSVFYYA
jgi:hypothetical protein